MRRALAVVFGLMLGGCLTSTYTPLCQRPVPGTLASTVWGGVQPGTGQLVLLNADLQELYCGPFLTVLQRSGARWKAKSLVWLPDVKPGTPSLPLGAGFARDGSLWIGERRGRRLLHVDATWKKTESHALGMEPSAILLSEDNRWLFASDATGTRFAACRLDKGTIDCTSEALQGDAEAMALAVSGSTLWIAYQGGLFLSRWEADEARWLPPVAPAAAQTDFAATAMAFADNGDLLLTLPALKRVGKLASADQYHSIVWSEVLGLPAKLKIFGNRVLVHDRLYGDWWLDRSLQVTGAVEGSVPGVLWFWQEGAAASLRDMELQQW